MKDATTAVTAGRAPHDNHGVVNPPVYHASTILFPSFEALKASRNIPNGDGVTYGRSGTPGTFAFEDAVTAVGGGFRTRLAGSGLEACTAALLSFLKAGDHLLVPDSVYGPTRRFATRMLKRLGIATTFYDPLIGAGIAELIRPETRVVYVESPGSWTFEVQDIPAIAEVAKAHGCTVILDNTWASPLYFKAFEHGVDVSVQAATKYIVGHSDTMMGTATATEEAYPTLRDGWTDIGVGAGPDDVYLAMRGIRTIQVRLQRHWENGLKVAEWLAGREEVAGVIHPALPDDPGHAIWRRDFVGASSLFAFVLKPEYRDETCLAALLDRLELHGMGYSWGGYESLLIPVYPERLRTATSWPNAGRPEGQVMRIHVGLEDPDDLIDDLAAGFARMTAARG